VQRLISKLTAEGFTNVRMAADKINEIIDYINGVEKAFGINPSDLSGVIGDGKDGN